ncbi:MAG: hypothetical protein R2873_03975 [Caldilineaceae bacterium]
MPLNIGIIGAGQAGERHAVGFSHVPSTQVVGIADLVLPRRRRWRRVWARRRWTIGDGFLTWTSMCSSAACRTTCT